MASLSLSPIQDIFQNGTYEERIEALSTLGSNLAIGSKSVRISTGNLYQAVQKRLLEARAKNPDLEPEKN